MTGKIRRALAAVVSPVRFGHFWWPPNASRKGHRFRATRTRWAFQAEPAANVPKETPMHDVSAGQGGERDDSENEVRKTDR